MERQSLNTFKPGVNRRVHLLAAGLLWTVVGMVLIGKGLLWIDPLKNIWFVLIAMVLGSMKSFFILDRSAKKSVERIARLRDGTCLGAVYSWKTWILVIVMMASGFLLRTFFYPGKYIGTLYCAVGWALLMSSRHAWIEWYRWIKTDD